MLKTVLFDLDGTLLAREASVEQFITGQYDRLSVHFSHIPKIDYVTRFIQLDCHGQVWKDKVYQTLFKEFNILGISWQALLDDYETQFHPEADIWGAKSAKMGTISKRNFQGLQVKDADAIIDELSEISVILEQFKNR